MGLKLVQLVQNVKIMNYLKTLLIICISISVMSANAQTGVLEAKYKYGNKKFEKFLLVKLNEQRKMYNLDGCITSASFAKFTIDTLGNIKNLIISEVPNSLPSFKRALTAMVMATSGDWLPKKINGKLVESYPFILPLIYDLEAGCNVPDISSALKTPFKEKPNRLFDALNRIYYLNKIDSTYCILLNPIITSSQR
jgi:hypothetical protein